MKKYTWRVNEIVVLAVLAAACSVIFAIWNTAVYPAAKALLVAAPEYRPLIGGAWLLAGVLCGYIIRRPGAALAGELIAAFISSMLPGGAGASGEILLSGLIQGVGAEIIFALFLYRRWDALTALAAGALSGAFMGISELIIYYAGVYDGSKAFVYALCSIISGAILAGGGSWLLTRALAQTGVLASLASGTQSRSA